MMELTSIGSSSYNDKIFTTSAADGESDEYEQDALLSGSNAKQQLGSVNQQHRKPADMLMLKRALTIAAIVIAAVFASRDFEWTEDLRDNNKNGSHEVMSTKELQISNYIKGTAIIVNIHITHHAGTFVCSQMALLGPTPNFACMGKGEASKWPSEAEIEATPLNMKVGIEETYLAYNETQTWATLWGQYFHFVSLEYGHYKWFNLSESNWEYKNLVSMIVMRDPMERFLAEGKCGIYYRSLPDDPTEETQDLYWEYANSKCADNYALRALANRNDCVQGANTFISCLQSAKDLLSRFTFILDQSCLFDSMVGLGKVLNLNITKSGFESRPHHKRTSLRHRFGNDTLYEYVKTRFRRDIELYEWSKKHSIVVCNDTRRN